MAFITLQSVGLSFGTTLLFDEINLTIEKGERVALVGRNGSGKSTLLQLVAGDFRPDSGIVALQ
jgi:ATPase subunit of ABC transporter with duplicated ATPase domains